MLRTSFQPQHRTKLFRPDGYTETGDVQLGEGIDIRFTPIRLETVVQRTSIRTDKSGSKNNADEIVFIGRICVHPDVKVKEGDIIEVFGPKYKAESVFPRYELQGLLHHYQVDLIKWQA